MTLTPNTGAPTTTSKPDTSKLPEKLPEPPKEKLMEYGVHPIATVFPAMSTEEFNGLRADIEERGLQEPIWLYQAKILDGRHRYRACKELGITPAIKQYTDNDPVGFVLGANLHRRHLNETQRAMIAARLVTTRLGDNQHLRKEGRSIDLATAADMLNISEKSVKRAKAVCQDGAPELIALVDSGEVAVSAAEKIVVRRETERRERPRREGRSKVAEWCFLNFRFFEETAQERNERIEEKPRALVELRHFLRTGGLVEGTLLFVSDIAASRRLLSIYRRIAKHCPSPFTEEELIEWRLVEPPDLIISEEQVMKSNLAVLQRVPIIVVRTPNV